ncbi:MAG: hypothetical protein Q8L48_32915 [Archangium sp.]|nr:hypothetical protein [Archangium sp.]
MMSSSWLFWMIFMFMFLMLPVGYGSGYRRWGAPLPRYFQQRRGDRAAAAGTPMAVNALAWGWGGDFVWGILFIGVCWAVVAMFWR